MGDIRVKDKFLFFPTRIGREWRWLEYVCIEQMLQSETYIDDSNTLHEDTTWVNLRFLD